MGRLSSSLGAAVLNMGLFAACCFIALRSGFGLLGIACIVVLSFGLIGAIAKLWSTNVVTIVLPAALTFVAASAILKRAIHVTDEGGTQFADPFWHYVLEVTAPEVIALSLAIGVAALGWSLSWPRKAQMGGGTD